MYLFISVTWYMYIPVVLPLHAMWTLKINWHLLFEYRKDFQKIQVLINWRNSLPIRGRYMYILYMYTAIILAVIFHSLCTMDTKCQVHIAITELFFIIRVRQGGFMARTVECWTLRIKWSRFEPWPESCVGGRNVTLSSEVELFSPTCINGYHWI